MQKDPLHTRLCEMLGIQVPIIAFTHCREVAVEVINAGGFSVVGAAMRSADQIVDDIRWLRERIDGKPFGIDLVLPSTAPQQGTPDELIAEIPEEHHAYARKIIEDYDVPRPKNPEALRSWGGMNKSLGRSQLDVLLEERVPVIAPPASAVRIS